MVVITCHSVAATSTGSFASSACVGVAVWDIPGKLERNTKTDKHTATVITGGAEVVATIPGSSVTVEFDRAIIGGIHASLERNTKTDKHTATVITGGAEVVATIPGSSVTVEFDRAIIGGIHASLERNTKTDKHTATVITGVGKGRGDYSDCTLDGRKVYALMGANAQTRTDIQEVYDKTPKRKIGTIDCEEMFSLIPLKRAKTMTGGFDDNNIETKKQGTLICEMCIKDSVAEMICKSCQKMICRKCEKRHERIWSLMFHTIRKIE